MSTNPAQPHKPQYAIEVTVRWRDQHPFPTLDQRVAWKRELNRHLKEAVEALGGDLTETSTITMEEGMSPEEWR